MALPLHNSFGDMRMYGLYQCLPRTPAYPPSEAARYFAEPSVSPADNHLYSPFFQATSLPQGPTPVPLPHLASPHPYPSWDGPYNNEPRRNSHDSSSFNQSASFSPSIPDEEQSFSLEKKEKSPGNNQSRLSRHGSNSSHRCKKIDPCGPFKCKWKDCRYSGLFARKAVLMRHIETQHVAPRSYECPDEKCDRCFNRKDNMEEHWRRAH